MVENWNGDDIPVMEKDEILFEVVDTSSGSMPDDNGRGITVTEIGDGGPSIVCDVDPNVDLSE